MTSGNPRRDVGSSLVLEVSDPTAFVLAVAVAEGVPTADESLRVQLDGEPIVLRETTDAHGTRLHLFETGPGILSVDYAATVIGHAAPPPVVEGDRVTYLRPSRYVQSDSLTDRARELFAGLDGLGLVAAVEEWVHDHLDYSAEHTTPTGGAVETLEVGAGVCRDFHAVVEAQVDERWIVVDATRLAPRSGLVRIATGRDSADTAFLTNTLADIELLSIDVRASGDSTPDSPSDVVILR
jgi:transglutaminase-like putative cysteine protease